MLYVEDKVLCLLCTLDDIDLDAIRNVLKVIPVYMQ